MNFAKQLIKQAIKDGHLLLFTTPDEQYDYYGRTTNYHKALELLEDVDCQCLIKFGERIYAHKKPRYRYIDQWVICNPYPDEPEESVIDYPCNGYVDNWFKKNDPDTHPYLDI